MIDLQLFTLINNLAGKSRILDLLGIFLADYLGYFLILIVVYLIFSQGGWRMQFQRILFIVLALILSRGLLTEIIRYFYTLPRPFQVLEITPLIVHDITPTFPSGHAALYFGLALAVFYFINRSWGWGLIIGALLMGLARVFVGIHWPLDILGGLLVALVSVYITKYLFEYKIPFRSKLPLGD